MQRRNLSLAAAAFAACAARAQQHSGTHHVLPVAPSSLDPYAKLQGGVPPLSVTALVHEAFTSG